MARGVGEVDGWPAVACVAGLGAALLVAGGILWLRARSLRDRAAALPTYRTVATAGSSRASDVRGLAVVLVALCVLSQLLYIGLYIELAQWLLGARELPRISADLFFWVLLIDVTCIGGALYTGLKT